MSKTGRKRGKFKILGKQMDKGHLLLAIILLFFLAFTSFFALKTKKGISPDENYHYHVSMFYSETLGIPENSEETFIYGDITRTPFLYFWTSGRIINANFTGLSDLIVIRFVNLLYSLGVLIFVYLLSKEVIKNKYLQLVPLFFLSNTLMFVFLSGSVSYDNLANLFSIASIYFLIRHLKEKKSSSLILWLIAITAGLLTKLTLAPLVLIEFVLLIWEYFKNRKLPKITKLRKSHYAGILLVVLFIVLNIIVYGVNIFRFKSLTPSCIQVLTHEECSKNALYLRELTVERTDIYSKSGLLEVFDKRLSPYEYVFDWVLSMASRTYGVFGHRSYAISNWLASLYVVYFGGIFLLGVRKFKKEDKTLNSLVIIAAFYITFVLFFHNYLNYLKTGRYLLALQGRYLFPVLPVFYVASIAFVEKVKNKIFRTILLLSGLLLFFIGFILFFIDRFPVDWFN